MEIKSYSIKLCEDSVLNIDIKSITSSDDVEKLFRPFFEGACEEYCYIATLNVKGAVTGVFEVSHGDLCGACIHPREVYKRAILNNSAAIIMCHNHPSGDSTPSDDDISATYRIANAGDVLGIKLIDHVIIGDGITSLKAEGVL